MDKKAAIGLSINTLVVVIISLVVLGAGVTLLYKFLAGADDLKAELDVKTNNELERLLVNQGQQVALPLHLAELERGGKHVFGIGILNIGEVDKFTIEVDVAKVVDGAGNKVENLEYNPLDWLLYTPEYISIEENEHRKESIMVNVPKEAMNGDYIFNAKVYKLSTGELYGYSQRFTVKVLQ
jgi:hypothetical protein